MAVKARKRFNMITLFSYYHLFDLTSFVQNIICPTTQFLFKSVTTGFFLLAYFFRRECLAALLDYFESLGQVNVLETNVIKLFYLRH